MKSLDSLKLSSLMLIGIWSLSSPAQAEIQQLITNGNFNNNSSGWVLSGDMYADSRFDDFNSPPAYAYLSDPGGYPDDDLDGEMYQTITIPEGTAATTVFTFWYYITTTEPSGAWDTLRVTVRSQSGGFLEELVVLDNRDTPPAGLSYIFWNGDLNDYIGQTIQIHFEGKTDVSYPTTFRIDDVSLLADVPSCDSRPDSDTNNATNITQTSARIHGDVDPNGCETEAWFQWGLSPDNLPQASSRVSAGSGTSEVAFQADLTSLACGLTIYYEMFSENAAGVDNDGSESFTTTACDNPPVVQTLPAFAITDTRATLNGSVNPNGLPTVYNYSYRIAGSSDPIVSVPIPAGNAGSGMGPVQVPITIDGLACNEIYEFYLLALSGGGNDIGSTLNFSTDTCAGHPGDFFAVAADPFCDLQEPAGPAVRLHWTESAGADTYTLYRDGVVYPNGVGIEGATFLNSLGLTPGGTYEYFLFAMNDLGSTASNTVTVSVPVDVCDAPSYPPLNEDVDDGGSHGGGSGGGGSGNPVCGNGTVESGEECDLGLDNGMCPSLCSDSCTVNTCNANEPPDGTPDSYGTNEDSNLVVPAPGVVANDSDPDGDSLQAILVSQASDGSVALQPDGSFTYTPQPNFFGDDSFEYVASDGDATSGTVQVDILVGSVNDAPTISIVEPDGVGDTGDQQFVVSWTDEDVDNNASIELRYSTNPSCSASQSIVSGIGEDDSTDHYSWDTSVLPDDSYWIQGIIDDGQAPPASNCSSGPVTVSNGCEAGVNSHSVDLERDDEDAFFIVDDDHSNLDLTGSLTFESWVYFESEPAAGELYRLIGKWQQATGDESFDFYANHAASGFKRLVLKVADAGGTIDTFFIPFTPSVGVWQHLAVSWDGSTQTAQFYVDGVPTGSPQTGAVSTIADTSTTFTIGTRSTMTGDFFDGELDDVRVWSVFRSEAQIRANRSRELPCGVGGLAGYWRFNGDGTDYSGHGNHLSELGTPHFSGEIPFPQTCAMGENSHAAIFDADANQAYFVHDDDHAGLDVNGSLTFESWVRFESEPAAAETYRIIGKWQQVTGDKSFDFFANHAASGFKRLVLQIADAGGAEDTFFIPFTPSVGSWQHLAVSWDASTRTAQFYVDGVPTGSPQTGVVSAITDSAAAFTVGTRSSMSGDFFDGALDEVRVWTTARSQQEIADNRLSQLPCSEQDLVGYWRFNDDGGLDYSERGNHLTPLNAPTSTTDIPFPASAVIFFDDFESGDTSLWTTTVP